MRWAGLELHFAKVGGAENFFRGGPQAERDDRGAGPRGHATTRWCYIAPRHSSSARRVVPARRAAPAHQRVTPAARRDDPRLGRWSIKGSFVRRTALPTSRTRTRGYRPM